MADERGSGGYIVPGSGCVGGARAGQEIKIVIKL